MVSTPSRSRAATRISLPCMVGPTSARSRVAAFLGSVIVLLMSRIEVLAGNRGQTKTHDRCQPWVFVEIALSATHPGGIARYDNDGQSQNLQRHESHHSYRLNDQPAPGQVPILQCQKRFRVDSR